MASARTQRSALRKHIGSTDMVVVTEGIAMAKAMAGDATQRAIVDELLEGTHIDVLGRLVAGPELKKRVKADFRSLVGINVLLTAQPNISMNTFQSPPNLPSRMVKGQMIPSKPDPWCAALHNLDAFAGLQGLTRLSLVGCNALSDVSGVRQTGLQHLTVQRSPNATAVPALKGLDALTALISLNLTCAHSRTVDGLAALTNLQAITLNCPQLRTLEALPRAAALRTLTISGCDALTDLAGIGNLSGLVTLYAARCAGLRTLNGLAELPSLQTIDLSQNECIDSIADLRGLPELHTIKLQGCKALRDLNGIQHLTALRQLDVRGCPAPLAPLANINTLQVLQLNQDTSDLSPLCDLPQLHTIALSNAHYPDINAALDVDTLRVLTDLPGLQKIILRGAYWTSKQGLSNGRRVPVREQTRASEVKSLFAHRDAVDVVAN